MPEPVSSNRVYPGRFIAVDVEEWPGIGSYEVLRHPGAAAVLPITPTDDVLLVKQLRPPVRQIVTEIPAGLLDVEGEDALTCAARELYEETGYRHASIEFLGGYFSSVGSSDEYVHLFWARTEGVPHGTPEQDIELVTMPLGSMLAAARAGRVRDAKTALALLLYAARTSGV